VCVCVCVCVCVGSHFFCFFFFERIHIDWPISNFLGTLLGMPLIEAAPLWNPSCKIENKCAPLQFYLFSLYTWELNFGQTIWDHKTQVPLGTCSGMHLGTVWELNGNMLGTHWVWGKMTKKTISSQNCLSLFLSYAKGRGRILGTKCVCVCVCVCVMHILYIKYAKGILKWEIMQQI
jgi:hypothetical protein